MIDDRGSNTPRWDAAQYARFGRERAQPFHDLVSRVPEGDYRRIADLGCGSGELTRTLLDRWPAAELWGIDSSPEMLSQAGTVPRSNVHFVLADIRDWQPDGHLDLIVSNAALHWIPDHALLLDRLVSMLGPAGVLAVQVPNHRGEPAYEAIASLASEPPWEERLRGVCHRATVEAPRFYEEALSAAGLDAQVWETVYYHRLPAHEDILEWIKGTTLRPILSALTETAAREFVRALGPRFLSAYEPDSRGVLFPFRRLFFVARKEPD